MLDELKRITKKLLFRVFVYGLLIVLVGIIINWGFLLVMGGQVWSYDRPGGVFLEGLIAVVLIVVFLVIFPFLYVWGMKGGAIMSLVGTVWGEYRDDLAEGIISSISGPLVRSYSKVESNSRSVFDQIKEITSALPWGVRFLIDKIEKKIPLLEEISTVVDGLDTEAFQSEEKFEQQSILQLTPYLEKTNIGAGSFGGIIKLFFINCIIIGVLIALFLL